MVLPSLPVTVSRFVSMGCTGCAGIDASFDGVDVGDVDVDVVEEVGDVDVVGAVDVVEEGEVVDVEEGEGADVESLELPVQLAPITNAVTHIAPAIILFAPSVRRSFPLDCISLATEF